MSFDDWIDRLNRLIETWGQSFSDPRHFLNASVAPTPQQTTRGFEFFLEMLAISLVLSSPLLIRHHGDFGDKLRVAANAAISVLGSLATALIWDVSFRILGGSSTFDESFLAFAYGLGPYWPLMTVASLMMVSALPTRLWPYAVNPLTADKAFNEGFNDVATKKSVLTLGFLMAVLILGVSLWRFFRCLEFVHGLRGLRAFGAAVVALLVLGVVGKVMQILLPTILPPLDEPAVAPPQP